MSLEIVLRTCDRTNVHNDWRVRYVDKPKKDIVLGCFISLLNSARLVNNVKLTVLDDHSSYKTKEYLLYYLKNSPIETEFVELEESGYNYSALKQFERCRDSKYDYVYSVEDDYLHCISSITEMFHSIMLFESKTDLPIVLYPFDEPMVYKQPMKAEHIVYGSDRHWRTGYFTTNVMMCRPLLIQNNWDKFESLAIKYNGNYLDPRVENYEESNTIWKIWEEGKAIRFNPIPSLALHLQFDSGKDPFICWEDWWKSYAK